MQVNCNKSTAILPDAYVKRLDTLAWMWFKYISNSWKDALNLYSTQHWALELMVNFNAKAVTHLLATCLFSMLMESNKQKIILSDTVIYES